MAKSLQDALETKHGGYGHEKVGVENGEFDGDVRYEGTILVERKLENSDEWVKVLTDKPRPGDRIEQNVLNLETGEYEQSKESTTKAGATRMPRKS